MPSRPAASRKLPFRFGRQVLAGPFRVGQGIPERDVNDGMIMQPADRTARSVGPSPVGTELECPPLVPAVRIDCMLRWIENQRARLEHVRQSARIIIRIWHDLGEGDIAGRIDEFAELAVCNWNAIDPERVDRHAMNWRLVRIVPVRSHAERTAGNPDHVSAAGELCCRVWRLLRRNSVKLHRRYDQLAI